MKFMTILQQGLRRYFSEAQLAKLAAVRVGIAGAGGLGSNCAMILARSGVRRFTIADFDRVDASNLNRQFFFPTDVGLPKVEALGRHLLDLDPELDLKLVDGRLEAESLPEVYAGCDILVEALDKAEYKAIFCNLFMGSGAFLVSASGLGGFGGAPMRSRKLGGKMVCVGDFSTEADEANPPLAPRVIQAAAMQADAVLEYILGGNS